MKTVASGNTEKQCTMGLLPCLRLGSDRWWLPCSERATDAIGRGMLASIDGRLDVGAHGEIISALKSDPPLLIFAALNGSDDRVDLDQLAEWIGQHVVRRFASGDAFLGAPTIDGETRQRWNRLRDHYRTLPLSRWMQDAALWLEVTGPAVPDDWQDQWPQVCDDRQPVASSAIQRQAGSPADGDGFLPGLARLVQRHRSLEACFDRQLQADKMAALEQLAYGLSHEINNPLANISTRAQQLQRGEDDATRSAVLQRIVDQVYRAHEMIADLMFYANPTAPQSASCDLRDPLLRVVEDFGEAARRHSIRLEIEIPDTAATVSADETMIAEATRAIIRNSIEAIGCQGTIVVSLVAQQDCWMIHIADSGPGLSEQARLHAFDPYYSGREAGRGLGLGLCRAYRIAKLHGGDITIAGGPTGCVATITLRMTGSDQ